MASEDKTKYLEFIQNIITRMNTNSFQLKGMSVTITSALLALTANNFNILYVSIVYFSLFIFWGLDAYYLSQKRGYRKLYNDTRKLNENEVDFNLKLESDYLKGKNSWSYTLTNKTILPLYVLQALISLVLIMIFRFFSA